MIHRFCHIKNDVIRTNCTDNLDNKNPLHEQGVIYFFFFFMYLCCFTHLTLSQFNRIEFRLTVHRKYIARTYGTNIIYDIVRL